jgi:hypothetical protein
MLAVELVSDPEAKTDDLLAEGLDILKQAFAAAVRLPSRCPPIPFHAVRCDGRRVGLFAQQALG